LRKKKESAVYGAIPSWVLEIWISTRPFYSQGLTKYSFKHIWFLMLDYNLLHLLMGKKEKAGTSASFLRHGSFYGATSEIELDHKACCSVC
jgi:hypothetical protein